MIERGIRPPIGVAAVPSPFISTSDDGECGNLSYNLVGQCWNWLVAVAFPVSLLKVHWSVYERTKLPQVLIYDEEKPYRPELLSQHKDFAALYAGEGQEAAPPKLIA